MIADESTLREGDDGIVEELQCPSLLRTQGLGLGRKRLLVVRGAALPAGPLPRLFPIAVLPALWLNHLDSGAAASQAAQERQKNLSNKALQ